MERGRDGKPELRASYDVRGVPTCPPVCRTEKGCPKGTPEKQRSLNPENQLCYEHYRECKAVGQFPDDPVVRRNAGLIRDVEDRFERTRQTEFQTQLIQLVSMR